MTDIIITQAVADVVITETSAVNVVTDSSAGPQGLSAYQVALNNGFIGTEQQWLDSLTGTQSDITLTKTALEIANVAVNFSNRLTQGDYITSTTSVVATPSGLTITDISNSSSTATFKASGGNLLQGYKIDITVATFLGSSISASLYLLNI